jgi:hypothetical protein
MTGFCQPQAVEEHGTHVRSPRRFRLPFIEVDVAAEQERAADHPRGGDTAHDQHAKAVDLVDPG